MALKFDEIVGLASVALCAFLQTFGGVFVSLSDDLPTCEILAFKMCFQLLFSLIFWYLSTEQPKLDFKLKILWTIRGLSGSIGLFLYINTLTLLPLGDSVAIISFFPIFAAFFARVWLKESLRPIHFFALLLCAGSVILISQPPFIFSSNDDFNVRGIVVAIVTSVTWGFGTCTIRAAKDCSTPQLMLAQSLFAMILSGGCYATGMERNWSLPKESKKIGYLFGVMTAGFMAQTAVNFGGRKAPAIFASVVRVTDVLWAYIAQVLIFNTHPNIWTIIGAVTMVFGILSLSAEGYIRKNTMVADERKYSRFTNSRLSVQEN